jgi:anti-sigma-K factor RskA
MTHDMDNSSHNPWPELLAGYVLGDLSSDDMIRVKQHLETHPEAVEEVRALEMALGLLPLGLPSQPVPPYIKTNLFKQIAPVAIVQPRGNRRWLVVAGGMAAAAIAALGFQIYQLQARLQGARQEVAALRSAQEKLAANRDLASLVGNFSGRKLEMVGSGAAAGAKGEVFIMPEQNRAVLAVDNMPPPPPGKVYHLWAVVEGTKVACIQFVPERDGKVLMQLPANRWSKAVQMAVTLEPVVSEAVPTGDMVMVGDQI